MIIERYRLNNNSNGSKGYNLITSLLTYDNNSGVFNNGVIAKNSIINSLCYNTSRTYKIDFKLKSYLNFGGLFILDIDSNNGFTGIGTLTTSGGLRLKEGGGDTIIDTSLLELNKWYQIILTYDRISGICKAWKNGKYLGQYNGIINYNNPIGTTLQLGQLESIYFSNCNIKEVELYNNSISNAFAKNKYMQSKGIF